MFRRSLILVAAAILIGAPNAGANVLAKIRVEGFTRTIFGSTNPACRRDQRARCSEERRQGGRVLRPRDADVLRPVRRPGRLLRRLRLERMDVQGERRLAAGRRRPVRPQAGRQRALVLGALRARREGRRRSSSPARSAAVTGSTPSATRGRGRRRSAPSLHVDGRSVKTQGATQAAVGMRRPAPRPRPGDAQGRRPVQRSAVRRALALAVVAAALAGCGGTAAERGHATLWVTRDRGTQVLLVRTVPAGLTAMQALDRVADIETTYGGRYVQSISGIDGSMSSRHDWFYFVNGIEGDRSAAEVPPPRGRHRVVGLPLVGEARCDSPWWSAHSPSRSRTARPWCRERRMPSRCGSRSVSAAPAEAATSFASSPGRGFRAELNGDGVVGDARTSRLPGACCVIPPLSATGTRFRETRARSSPVRGDGRRGAPRGALDLGGGHRRRAARACAWPRPPAAGASCT